MAAVDIGTRDAPLVNDDLDDLFNYNVDHDLFKEVDTNMDVAREQPIASRPKDLAGSGLGLDEEIKVTKKRAPIAKLDESRFVFSIEGDVCILTAKDSCLKQEYLNCGERRKSG